MSEKLNEARVERYCPDPRCDWKLVEPLTHQGVPLDFTATIPWEGSAQASLAGHAARLVADHHAVVELACEAHIREAHDADDPIGWATRMVEQVRAAEEGL